MQLFIRRVDVVIGQPETGHDRLDAQHTLHLRHDRDRAALALEIRLFTPNGFHRRGHRLYAGVVPVRDRRRPAVHLCHFPADILVGLCFEISVELLRHVGRILVRDEAHGDLRHRPGRDDGLRAGAGKARQHTIDIQRGTRPGAFCRSVIRFSV